MTEHKDAGHLKVAASVPRERRGSTVEVTDLDVAIRMYESGMSVRAIAPVVGLPVTRLWRRLRRAGVIMRSFEAPAPARDDQIVQLRTKGLTWGEIGAAVGMTAGGARNRHHTVTGFPPEPTSPLPGTVRISDAQILQLIGGGATHRETADMLGLTAGAVTARVYRARRRRREASTPGGTPPVTLAQTASLEDDVAQ